MTQTLEPVALDMTDAADWYFEIEDIHLVTGDPISHVGDSLRAELRDADGTLVTTATSANGVLSILGGTDNVIVYREDWSVIKDRPGGTYFTEIVKVNSATSRDVIVPVIIRHSIGSTQS